MQDQSTVLYTLSEGVARITLNRPDKLNSFNAQMFADLGKALEAVESDASVRAVVLSGAGRGFCAGQDLAEVIGPDAQPLIEVGDLLKERFNPLVRRIQRLPKPVLARVQGTAAGAGANLALACDLVIAGRSASFLQAFIHIGLMPDAGGTWFLPRRIGSARALGLAMLGEKLPAEQAAEWGLIWKCVEDAALDAEVDAIARKLAALPTAALAAIKSAMGAGASTTLDGQLELEHQLQSRLGQTRDYREGVGAFLAKRPARFEGR